MPVVPGPPPPSGLRTPPHMQLVSPSHPNQGTPHPPKTPPPRGASPPRPPPPPCPSAPPPSPNTRNPRQRTWRILVSLPRGRTSCRRLTESWSRHEALCWTSTTSRAGRRSGCRALWMEENPGPYRMKSFLWLRSLYAGRFRHRPWPELPPMRQMGALRGLMAVPDDVDFGVLREGNTYVYPVQLKNVGVDSCRFKVKQPPPSTGLRVLYNPGPIAAGMKADLNLEIYAIAVGAEGEKGVGRIAHHIEITTETDLLYLPVTATILTAAEHDNRSLGSPRGGKAPAAKLISTKPPSGQGILRPRRDVLIEGLPSMG
ncbi:uncharacterized protein [Branchiostoma lanceolatum]|uniref:uncharacterized protein isoform X2 n=1 Tax=Branchiostoma lanceolatum TaxID=7740 RepID=UPI003451E97D